MFVLCTVLLLFGNLGLQAQVISNNGAVISISSATAVSNASDVNNTTGTISNNGSISISGNYTNAATTNGSGTYAVGGNWTNNGTFTAGTSTVTLNGGAAQSIGGTALTTFNNLSIANTSGGVSLSSAETVNGTLTLTSGILTTTATNILSFVSSTAISGGSVSSFINGPVKWSVATGSYIFPMGKGAVYLPFKLVTSAASSPIITVEAFNSDVASGATVDATLASISHTEYWQATLNSGSFIGNFSLTRGTALTSENAIGSSTAQVGPYASIGGTPASPSINTSNNISSLGYFVMATRKQTIATGMVTGAPFCINSTTSASGTVAFSSTGSFTSATFTAKLSDASGSFASPNNIGLTTVNGSNPSGNITITIPAGTASGAGYKIRVDCTSPAITGTTNAAFEIVNGVNDVSSPSASTGDGTATLLWVNPANCYNEIMIVAKAGSAVSGIPSGNGSAYTANTIFGSGSVFGGGFVAYKGVSSPQTVTGLTNGTTYYFKFFTRNGSDWSSGVEISASSTDASLASDYFRSKGTGNWSTPSTWESSHDGTNWFNATLSPTSVANKIIIQNLHIVTVSASVSIDQTSIDAGGKVIVNSGQTLTIANGTGTDLVINGTLTNSGTITPTGTLAFNGGGIYEHAEDGGTIPTAIWDVASSCNVTGITSTSLSGLNQTFGNLTWNCAGQTVLAPVPSGDLTVYGNFILGGGIFTLSNGTTRNLTIKGNYIQTGGVFNFNNATNTASRTKMYLEGNLTNSLSSVPADGSITTLGLGAANGEIIFSGSSMQSIIFSMPASPQWVNFTVNPSSSVKLLSNLQLLGDNTDVYHTASFTVNGTLDIQNYIISHGGLNTGATIFALNSGGSIITENTGGLSLSGATGCIQSSIRSYHIAANYIYNGAFAQVTGNGLTGANNLTINNSAGVALSNAVSVTGNLSLTNGILTTTGTNLLSVTNTNNTAISVGSSSYINGPVRWTLPASLGSGTTYNFPVGTGSSYLPFSLVNPTTGTGIVTAQVESFTANPGGTIDATLFSKSNTEYWSLIPVGNFNTSSVSLATTAAITPFNVVGGSTAQTGTYTSLDGTASANGVSGSDAIGLNHFFVLAEKKKPSLSIAATNQATEGGNNGLFTITTSSQFAVATTVNITVSGTATNGTDYTTIGSTFTFPANSNTTTIPVTVIEDLIYEGPETVLITLIAGTGYSLGTPANATVTIADNDSPTIPMVLLSVDKASIPENGNVATITATLSNTYSQTVTIWLDYSGTASNVADYTYSSNSITITPGNLIGTATITTVNDCVVEGNESVIVDVASVTNGTESGTQRVTTTIVDDDFYPTVTLLANNLSIPEKAGVSTVTATLSNTFCQDIDIYLDFNSSTATNSTDYNYSSNKITIPSGSLSGTITISSVNDYQIESTETVVVRVSSINVAGISTTISPATITIVDDDSYTITVTPTSGLYTTEAGGPATFTVVLNAITYNDVTIQLTSSDLTEGTVSPASLTFTSGNFFTPQTVTITGVNDDVVDGNISYTILTSAVVSFDTNYNGINPPDVSVINIDNDGSSDNFWFMADSGITGNVTSWADRSGNGINATNTGIVTKIDNSVNFNPSLSFTSVNRQFTVPGTRNVQTFIVVSKTPNTNSDLAGLIGADGDKGIRLANSVNELTPVVTPYESWKGNNNADDWVNVTNGGTGRINGIVDADMVHSSKWHIANLSRYQALSGNYYIGGYVLGRTYSGNIAEVLAFDNDPSDGTVESYLALKYGITLGNNANLVSYVNYSGSAIWTGSSTYQNDIAGIGKEIPYMLDQKVSASINTPTGTSGRVVMATDNDFTSSNQVSRTSLGDGQFLIWGHNNSGVGSLTIEGSIERVDRIWRVQNTGVSSSVNFQIDLTGFPVPLSDLSLIRDNDADFSNGGTTFTPLTKSSGNLYQTSLSFPAGTSYFTIGKCIPPTVTVNSPTICAGGAGATIMATPTPAVTYTYAWTVPTGVADPGNVSSFNASVAGEYSVTISNSFGCTGNNSGTLTVNPTATITGSSNVCLGSTLQLTGSGTAAITNPWISDTPSVATVNSTGLVSTVAAGNSVIIYTDSNGCFVSKTITVDAMPVVTGQPADLNLCLGTSGSFTVITSASSPGYQWQYSIDNFTWINIDGVAGVSGHTSNTLTISSPPLSYSGYYVKCLITSDACSTATSSVRLTVNVLPDAPTATDITVTYDGSVHTASANPPSGSTIVWYNAATGGNSFTNLSATQHGIYTAWAESKNTTTGCSSATRIKVTLTINPRPITITADPKSKNYGGTDPALNYQITSGTIVSGDPISGFLSRTSGESTGSYSINKNTLTFGSNYTETYVGANLIINKVDLIITADIKTKGYDGAVYSPFTVNYSGFVNGEQNTTLGGSLIFSGTAVSAKNSGTGYTIIPGGYTSTNYNISFVGGTLDILKATVTPGITANSKCFDGNASATLSTKTLTGVISPDDVNLDLSTVSFSDAAVGTGKAVTATGLTLSGTDAGNYTLGATTTAATTASIYEQPTITLESISNICEGATSFLIPYTSTTGSPNLYSISGSGITSASNAVLNASPIAVALSSPASSGTITYTLTVYNNTSGCVSGSINGSLTVNAVPTAPSTMGGQICIGSTAMVSASGASAGDVYKWYSLSSGGTLLKTSSDNTDNTYTTPVMASSTDYWVSILSLGGCESNRIKVTASFPVIASDSQTTFGTDSWIGHVYDGTNSGTTFTENFSNYYGYYTEPQENIDQHFGGATNCFAINSTLGNRQIYTETFAVRYRMNSTKNGLYVVNLGSDAGSRLSVDGALVYNNWIDQPYTSKPNVLINLKGNSPLVYDFYENGGQNRIAFNAMTLVLANDLTVNTAQSICLGATGSAIGGDVYGTLPTGISLYGSGYQWAFGSSPTGPWTDIPSETLATYTPSTTSAPFNVAGTYYLIRKAILSSTNNVAPNPYLTTNESNVVSITVNALPTAYNVTGGGAYCSGGTGVPVGLDNSQTGINYQLYLGANPVGAPVSGIGSAISFGLQTAAGTYTVKATNSTTLCLKDMSSSATVTINSPASLSFTVSPGADVCAEDDVIYTTQSAQSNYVWTLPGVQGTDYTITSGGIGSTSNSVILRWHSSGTKTVTVIYDDPNGCIVTAATSTAMVHPIPIIGGFY